MPPPGSPSQSNAGQNHTRSAEPYYSNEDVALLHEIVVLAQELLPKLPDRERLPTNALFSAYYEVLPRIGINADHDSRYARVLFKIGGLRFAGTLYEKFEEIMSRMGIEIEFDSTNEEHDNDNEEDYSQFEESINGTDPAIGSDEAIPLQRGTPHKGQRRNSESSFWDLGLDSRTPIKPRRSSFSTVERVKDSADKTHEILQDIRPPSLKTATGRPNNRDEERPSDNAGTRLTLPSPMLRGDRGRSLSTHGSMRIRRRSASTSRGRYQHSIDLSAPASEGYLGESELTAVTSREGEDTLELHNDVTRQDPQNHMEIKATLILQQHLARQQLRKWRGRTFELREAALVLNAAASSRDRISLLRSAFDEWRARFLTRNPAGDTIKFFAHLEQRASEARSVYLLHTAFTHWSAFANEHVQRTALARRHIVRTRVFNAWKEITAVNELKVRRQVLKKFILVWKRHYIATVQASPAAVQKYECNLVERVYRQWLAKLRDLRATAKWKEAAKRRVLFRWIVVSHNHWESRRSAEETRRLDLMWNTWKVWRDQTETYVRQDQQAESHYRGVLLHGLLAKWRREIQVIPAKITLQSDVATRRVRSTFRIWAHRARQERDAADVDRSRILREALTIWRHKSRARLVKARLDRRVKSQALYTWIVQDRTRLTTMTVRQNVFSNIVRLWLNATKGYQRQILDLENLAQTFAARQTKNAVLRKWYQRMGSKQQIESVAVDFHKSRSVRGVFSKWSAEADHLQELEQRSKDAAFYFATSKALKRWKASTETVRREKRKVAYAQVRRLTKRNLVRSVLSNWRNKTQLALSHQAQALEFSRNKDIIIGMNVFDRWRARADEIAEFDSLWRENILKKHFTSWREHTNATLALETEAVITYQETRTSRAVKRWSLLTLQRGALTNYAADVREKNAKKNFRRMFTYWHHKALQKRPQAKRVESIEPPNLGSTERAEAWSEFGEKTEMDEWVKGLEEGAVSTPIPAYLSTPSKRSERVLAVAARYSTTPRAPLSTPFEKQLRDQWSGRPLHSVRKHPGRSTLSMDQGFADIPEGGK